MAYTYCVRKNIVQDEEKKAYTVYGIEAVGSGGEILSSFSDVFFDRQRAERSAEPVSYTHLDVYKRQCYYSVW